MSKSFSHISHSDDEGSMINILWCDQDQEGKFYAFVEDWNTGINVCRFGNSRKHAQENACRELKRIIANKYLHA